MTFIFNESVYDKISRILYGEIEDFSKDKYTDKEFESYLNKYERKILEEMEVKHLKNYLMKFWLEHNSHFSETRAYHLLFEIHNDKLKFLKDSFELFDEEDPWKVGILMTIASEFPQNSRDFAIKILSEDHGGDIISVAIGVLVSFNLRSDIAYLMRIKNRDLINAYGDSIEFRIQDSIRHLNDLGN